MQQLLLKLTLIILLGNPILLSAQDAKGVKLDSNGLATLENLISSWETKTDILEKAKHSKRNPKPSWIRGGRINRKKDDNCNTKNRRVCFIDSTFKS